MREVMTELDFEEKEEGYWESDSFELEGDSFGLMIKLDEDVNARQTHFTVLRSANGETYTSKIDMYFIGQTLDTTIDDGVAGLNVKVRVYNEPEKIVVL